ncbi:unnamed protein product [Ilex paraguariensis]|uniref:Germin-like protein n=1 Tax=Ilex paraguariensis TaxID=185542 RepID=A0ABC8REM1_9AQUA
MANPMLLLSLLAVSFSLASAFDPSPLQDFCVADFERSVQVNGHVCLYPKYVHADNFSYSGLNIAGNTSNPLGSYINRLTVDQIPGLNTLDISTVRVDFAPGGVVPIHRHPRATEIVTVLEGRLRVGFVTSDPENRVFSKILQKGDVFVFPMGLVHFQQNVDSGNTVVVAFLNSQNPGVVSIADAVFGSHPPIDDDILAKAFQVDKTIVEDFRSQFN